MTPRIKPQANLLFRSLATGGAIELLYRIRDGEIRSEDLREESKLTRKQYYVRISQLIKEGIVRRKDGILNLTVFGKVIMQTLETQEKAKEMGFRLRSLDLILADKAMPDDVKLDMVTSLVPDREIQAMILNGGRR